MRALLVALLLASCAPGVRIGAPSSIVLPQAAEQCRAQPALDWCVASHGR